MTDARSTAIRSLLERTAGIAGPRIDAAAVQRLRARQSAAGQRAIEGPMRGALDASTYAVVQRAVATHSYADGLERCAGVAGSGQILAESMADTLCPGRPRDDWLREWPALWNLLAAFFDELCDEFGSLLPLLVARISPAALRAALEPGCRERLAPLPADPLLLRFVVEIADAVFSRFRSLAHRIPEHDYRRVARAIQSAYAGEIATARLRFSSPRDLDAVRRDLRAANSLTIWILGCTVALGAGVAPLPRLVDSTFRQVGNALWLVDDFLDLETDVGTDCWNAVYLVAVERSGASVLAQLRALPPEERIAWLYERGMVDALADRTVAALQRTVEDLEAAFGTGTPLVTDLLSTTLSFTEETLHRAP